MSHSERPIVHLERKGHLPEEVVRFWVAELASALEYLHRQRIIHRLGLPSLPCTLYAYNYFSDIKPDNILLDAMGHAHLTDFNVAIHYSERRMHTSVAGSMAYMAPEMVGRKGYTWCCDFWGLGVTAYELLFHKRPFDGRTAEKMTHSILKDPVKFPEEQNKYCSSAGVQALQAVSAYQILLARSNSSALLNSSWSEIQTDDWAVGQMAKDFSIYNNTLGSPLLVGTLLSPKKHSHLLFPMWVIFSLSGIEI
jgi:serine/threonine protein kinase